MGGKSTDTSRTPTEQELELLETQGASLEQAMKIAADQYSLSASDRDYFDKIYRGSLDKNDPKVLAEVQDRLGNQQPPERRSYENSADYNAAMVNYEGMKDRLTSIAQFELGDGVSVDTLLFDAVKSANPETEKLMTTWEDSARELGNDFIDTQSGMSDTFKQQLKQSNDSFVAGTQTTTSTMTQGLQEYQSGYETKAGDVASKLGTADDDLLALTTGRNLAGIASSFKQSQDQLMSAMSRRGLAGSGVEAQALGNVAGAQAQAQAQALSQSYLEAIQQSDARRQQQLGIAGQIAQTGQQTVGNIAQAQQSMYGSVAQAQQGLSGQLYQTDMQGAQSAYGIQSGLQGQVLNQNLAASQQNIANLQLASGVSQGVYGGASNMLASAGSAMNQNAQIAGNTATQIGQTDAQYKMGLISATEEAKGAATGAVAGLASTGMMAMALSDKRLKTNIQHVGMENGYNIYTWDWIEGVDGGYNTGVIAQEVQEIMPEAVIEGADGFLRVNYKMLGV